MSVRKNEAFCGTTKESMRGMKTLRVRRREIPTAPSGSCDEIGLF